MTPLLVTPGGVTLVGGGVAEPGDLSLALAHAPRLVAADGGADALLAAGHVPELVIGDLDSISAPARARLAARLHPVAEQDSTDFEKCLQRIDAPLILALGFTGARIDHELAVWNVIARRRAGHCIVIGGEDIVFLAPPRLDLDLPPGSRFSLFPMTPVRGESAGLRWPIGGIPFAPSGPSGTSNEVTGPVRLTVGEGALLVILPRAALTEVLRRR